MKVSTQKLPESQVLLEIELDTDQMDKSMDRAYSKLVQRISVPGFRKGNTPRPMLERHIGRGRILEEAIDLVVPEAYNQAIEDEDIDAIGQPSIELVTAEPLAFKATVPIRPTVDLGDYASVRVEREPRGGRSRRRQAPSTSSAAATPSTSLSTAQSRRATSSAAT